MSNLFLVRDGGLITPASDGEFLAGRTRERILKLAAQADLPARQRQLDVTDLATAAEVFVASSVREVLPVIRIDDKVVGNGRPGPLTRRLQRAYGAAVRGLPPTSPPAG